MVYVIIGFTLFLAFGLYRVYGKKKKNDPTVAKNDCPNIIKIN